MFENEVAPVIKALVENGIEVVAVHNPMVHEKPRMFFLHYWGVGPSEKFLQRLRAALNPTGKQASQASATVVLAFPETEEALCVTPAR